MDKGFSLQRQTFLDALRGMALLGILLVNISVFSLPFYGTGLADPLMTTSMDKVVSFLIAMLFETKFYLIFSFLFGYSFTIQMMSAERKGKPFAKSFMRRLLGLFIIGLLHAVFLYHGDILSTYAMMGVLLYACRKKSDATLFKLAGVLIIGTTVLWLAFAWLSVGRQINEAAVLANVMQQQQAYLGSFSNIMKQHLNDLSSVWTITIVMQAPMALAMFCLGLMAGRKQIFLHLDAYRPYFKKLWWLGVLLGLPVALFHGYVSVYGQNESVQLLALSLSILTGPLLSAAYVVTLIWCHQTSVGQRVIGLFQSAGRMALSLYVLQSLMMTFVFFGVGLGLMGQLSHSMTLMVALGIYAVLCVFSTLWLRYFSYGPLEWVLRSFTQWRIDPILKPTSAKNS